MHLFDIHILGIILAVIANTLIGAMWYSPLLFANIWMKSLEKTREELNTGSANTGYALTMIAAVVSALVLSYFISLLDSISIGNGALIGFLAGFGIAAARELSPTFFEARKMTLFVISAGYHIVALTVMGMILAAFA
ncbi:DUF1761 domain-containing protein [Paenisporosarcina indica]|uniref:DUF1761 domain-containing protein n=1 Tax=Paenisporosarcina indica TaxID=650093 RepID=UPI00094FF4CB|nr:DUF1761 domain-containing protein [Paenisporosarcina indica]